MTRKVERSAVYAAIDSERDYQGKWGDRTHTTTEYLLFMEDYLAAARRLASTTDMSVPEFDRKVLDFVRKVTALGVVCMEDNGAPQREGFER